VTTETKLSTRMGFTTIVITLTATAGPSFTQTNFLSSTNAAMGLMYQEKEGAVWELGIKVVLMAVMAAFVA
jgi:hypothetical protein